MLFITFFLFWISIQFGEVVEDFLAYILVISLGILHGANDLLILSIKEKTDKTFIKNLFIYIGIIILCLLIYMFSSFTAILFFVLLSSYHFGEEHLSKKINVNGLFNSFYFLAYGIFLFSLIFYQSAADVDLIMTELTGLTFTEFQIKMALLLSGVFLCIGSIYLVLTKKNKVKIFFREIFYLLLLYLVFQNSSLVLGFAIYFIFWHSIPSIIHQVVFISGNLNEKAIFYYVKKEFLNFIKILIGKN